MVYYVMRDKDKVISFSIVSTLEPSDYDVNKTKVRLKDLDNTIRGSIGDL